jgi:glycosyltransferase involved in cell wall biosynthesis
MPRVMLIGALAPTLIWFRGRLIRDLVSAGAEVLACAPEEDRRVRRWLEDIPAGYATARLRRAGLNPFRDALYFADLVRLMKQFHPDIVLSYTHKPVVFGTLAARACGVPGRFVIVTGLGYAFIGEQGLRQRAVRGLMGMLYRRALRGCRGVFFQNADDRAELLAQGFVSPDLPAVVVNGSGIDLEHFGSAPVPDGPVRYLLAARLLRDKGIAEYAEAGKMLKQVDPRVVVELLGPLDPNPSALKEEEIREWERAGTLSWLGETTDVRPYLAAGSGFVLPSYREGTPQAVLEAMAVGRAIITTDAPGCRETVRLTEAGRRQKQRGEPILEGENGYQVRVGDACALSRAMGNLAQRPAMAKAMGQRSRAIAEEVFDVRKVNRAIMERMGFATKCAR